jgi:hypothetical protein
MSPDRMSATSVAHKSTGGTLQSLPEPVDPVGDAPDYLTFKTVAPLRQPVCTSCLHFGEREKIRAKCAFFQLAAQQREPAHAGFSRFGEHSLCAKQKRFARFGEHSLCAKQKRFASAL